MGELEDAVILSQILFVVKDNLSHIADQGRADPAPDCGGVGRLRDGTDRAHWSGGVAAHAPTPSGTAAPLLAPGNYLNGRMEPYPAGLSRRFDPIEILPDKEPRGFLVGQKWSSPLGFLYGLPERRLDSVLSAAQIVHQADGDQDRLLPGGLGITRSLLLLGDGAGLECAPFHALEDTVCGHEINAVPGPG